MQIIKFYQLVQYLVSEAEVEAEAEYYTTNLSKYHNNNDIIISSSQCKEQ